MKPRCEGRRCSASTSPFFGQVPRTGARRAPYETAASSGEWRWRVASKDYKAIGNRPMADAPSYLATRHSPLATRAASLTVNVAGNSLKSRELGYYSL